MAKQSEEIAIAKPTRRGFRADLEGLRAIAVALVVIYHARRSVLPGGYIGVDVFYVLSGFFITRLLLNEFEARGRISFADFYARRMRRLLPAAATVVTVTVAASHLLLPPLRFAEVGRDAVATALYVCNFRFALASTDYLHYASAPSPFLHFWSLAVEEQFYLLWPALLALVLWPRRSSRRLAMTVAAVVACSFAASVWLTRLSQPWAFFTLPARAWELGAGALVAIAGARLAALPRRLRAAGGWLGLGLIAAAASLFSDATAFPGYAAALPVLGSVLVIAAVAERPGPGWLLSTRPLRALGRWSYSIYLWHWPLLILPAAYLERPLTSAELAAAIVATIALSAATYRFIETPPRRSQLLGSKARYGLVFGVCVSMVAAFTGFGLSREQLRLGSGEAAAASPAQLTRAASLEHLPLNLDPSLLAAPADEPLVYRDGCHLAFAARRSPTCVFGDEHSSRSVVLFGDSHAAQWFPAMQALAQKNHWHLESLTKSACPAVEAEQPNPLGGGSYSQCSDWHRAVLERLSKEHPELVVVSSSTALKPGSSERAEWMEGLGKMVSDLRRRAANVLVLGDVPHPASDVPVCLSAHVDDVRACTFSRASAVEPRLTQQEQLETEKNGGAFAPTFDWICPTTRCPVVVGDLLVYRDASHLTTPFSVWLADRLQPILTRTLGGAKPALSSASITQAARKPQAFASG